MHVPGRPLTMPATPMQESVWWAHQRARNRSIYNITWRMACDRAVDFDALALAWQAVVDRHEALRTSFARVGTTIQLTALPRLTVELGSVEVDDPGAVDVATLLRLIAEEHHAHVMPLERAPLARLTLVRVADRYELLLTVHHVVVDGWALQLLLGELSSAYSAAANGREPGFDDEPIPFHTYADEVHRARDEGRWEPSLAHWRKTLEGASAATVIADRQADSVVGAAGMIIRYPFSDEAAAGIAAMSKAFVATPFAAVLGAMQIVLARGGAGSDVTVGIVTANRMNARDQGLVGYTANLCISRATIDEEDSIAKVVAAARDGVWSMLAHQAVPYPAVFRALSPATQNALSEASPMMLSYLGPIATNLRLDDVELTFLKSPNRAARADIAMAFWDVDGGHLAEIEFNTARYDTDTVMRLLHDIDAVLAAGGVDPDHKVGALEVRTRSVRRESGARSVAGSAGASPASVPGSSPAPAPAGGAPESDISERVAAAWADVLGSPPSNPDVGFFAAGGNSLSLVRLAAALEAETGVVIDIVEWLSEPTARRIVAQLAGDGADGADTATSTFAWVRDGTGPHLHLLPGAGGGVHDFRALIAALPAHWRLTASEERVPLATVPMMARRYRADLDAAQARPDILAGWSMGGQVAYEMALGYEAPPALVVLDSLPPTGGARNADLEELRAATFATTVLRSFGVEPGCSPPRLRGDDELMSGVLAAYVACTGQQVSATLLRERWRTYRRHAMAATTYVRNGRVDAPALLVAADLLDAQLDAWAQRVGGEPRLLRVDADHHGVLRGAIAEQVAAAIEAIELGVAARS